MNALLGPWPDITAEQQHLLQKSLTAKLLWFFANIFWPMSIILLIISMVFDAPYYLRWGHFPIWSNLFPILLLCASGVCGRFVFPWMMRKLSQRQQ